MTDWSVENNRKLRKLWTKNIKVRDIAAEFGCSTQTIHTRCKTLNLAARARKWLPEDDEILRKGYADGTRRSVMGKRLKRTVHAITYRARSIGVEFVPIPSERLPKKEGHCEECACNPQSISVCCLPRCPHVTATEFYHPRSLTGSSTAFV